MYFGTNAVTVPPSTLFEVGVFVDTEGETVNAVSGSVSLPEHVTVDRIEDGKSLISLWVNKPTLDNGAISYEGIIPGGFTGPDLYLFSFFATADQIGDLNFSTDGARVLLHDGAGTDADVREASMKISVAEGATLDASEIIDDIPPEDFTPIITTDPSLFDGALVLIFSTTDKGSGIDHYEVAEYGKGFFAVKTWEKAEGPYKIQDVTGKKTIAVRAVDVSGNIREVSVRQGGEGISPLAYGIFAILGLALLALFVRSKVWRKKGGRGRK